MFTILSIKNEHEKVKSGADFPAFIRAIRDLGVTGFETRVFDGSTVYYGRDSFEITSPQVYETLPINKNVDKNHFTLELKSHQQGLTNYQQFVEMCAVTGIEKWIVSLEHMTCVYYDLEGNEILSEKIPA